MPHGHRDNVFFKEISRFKTASENNLFKLDMKRFVIVRNLLYVTACLTKLHIIARCIAEQTVGVRVAELKYLPATIQTRAIIFLESFSDQAFIQTGP